MLAQIIAMKIHALMKNSEIDGKFADVDNVDSEDLKLNSNDFVAKKSS